ncbi:hypothetical protein J5N97_001372 [Dioscorea zingiberensis]|uniref:BHLH domain-containing protein n=1 Tax=Dioscorea zingiberensis TaxID=325984 RepID=A0A9D5H2B0_9LILI|nr:hypothetical protein J5N97_001372 [Dioscorea zingiberensis]
MDFSDKDESSVPNNWQFMVESFTPDLWSHHNNLHSTPEFSLSAIHPDINSIEQSVSRFSFFSNGDSLRSSQDEEASSKNSSAKKRKRSNQDMELDQSENAKDETVSDPPKENYIHARREKISARMKFLQELVPGCSKVTGKAVMLDEIINYVQSLQRQVEFLSMKLATVNPQPEFNIDGMLARDDHSSSSISFSPAMIHPQLVNTRFAAINGFKEPISQIQSAWNEEYHHSMFQKPFESNSKPQYDQDEFSR